MMCFFAGQNSPAPAPDAPFMKVDDDNGLDILEALGLEPRPCGHAPAHSIAARLGLRGDYLSPTHSDALRMIAETAIARGEEVEWRS